MEEGQAEILLINETTASLSRLIDVIGERQFSRVFKGESFKVLKCLRTVFTAARLFGPYPSLGTPSVSTAISEEKKQEAKVALNEFNLHMFSLMVLAHESLLIPLMDETPIAFGSYRFTTMLKCMSVGRLMIACMISDLTTHGDNSIKVKEGLELMKQALKAAKRFTALSTLGYYDQLYLPEHALQLMWTLFHMSTCFETTSEHIANIIKLMAYHSSSLVQWLCVDKKKTEWNYAGISVVSELKLEDIATMLYHWERGLCIVKTQLNEYEIPEDGGNSIKQVKWNFRNYLNSRFQVNWDKEQCEIKCTEAWKMVVSKLGKGRISNKQTQDYQKLVFTLMLAPGLDSAYYDINPGVKSPIAPAERMLDSAMLRLCSFFTAAPMPRVAQGYLDQSIVVYDEKHSKRPHLPEGFSSSDYIYKKMCILIFVMLLEKLVFNAKITGYPFLDNWFLINQHPATLKSLPCRIIYYGTCFYMTNQKCQLIRISQDIPGAFVIVYLNELKKLNSKLGEFICQQFKPLLF
jgi:hypothetical protein